MRRLLSCFIAAALFTLSNAAFAALKTVTLNVPSMTCALCPITVKKALMKVPGVTHAEVSYEARQAVVTFDDVRTGTDALMQATRDAGYPSTVKGGR